MTFSQIANIRLSSQQIASTKLNTPKQMVGWMGAMQAQDYYMAKWSIGIRLPGSDEKLIETAINHGEIIRTHLLRPTWHLVSADDIYWMLDLTAPRIKAKLKFRHKWLELTQKIVEKSNATIAKALNGGNHLTRDQLVCELIKSKIKVDNLRAAHLMLWAELEGLICNDRTIENKTTYALLSDRVPKPKALSKEEALAKLAKKYFSSHCPATLQDFIWWSGLSVANARLAIEMIKPDFDSEIIGSQTFWVPDSFSFPKSAKPSAYLLPAYDEFIISYKDRSASIPASVQKHAISNNGIFRPVIVINGQVSGIWNRTIKKDRVLVETTFFKPPGKVAKALLGKAAGTYGRYLNKKPEITYRKN